MDMDHYTPALLEDIKRTADLCVKCNICTSACPVVPTGKSALEAKPAVCVVIAPEQLSVPTGAV